MHRSAALLQEFKAFLLRGNVVDLAVAVVIATAFGAVIGSFVENLLTPLIAAIFGSHDFSQLTFTINGSTFKYGSFVNALITFVSVAAAVFFVVIKPINALIARRNKGEEPAAEPAEDVKLLTEIRDILSTR